MNDYLVNVIVSTYNQEKYISECIECILMQKTKFSFNIIIGDDASTDKTQEVIKKYYYKYPKSIRPFYREKNIGANKNSQLSYNEAQGKYIAICDGDDYWTDPYKLQKQVDFLENNPDYAMCFTNSVIVDENNNVLNNSRVPKEFQKEISQTDILNGFCPPSNTVLIRWELVENELKNWPENIINGDYYLFTILAGKGKVGYVDIISAAYRKHSEGLWSQKDKDYIDINYIDVNRKLYPNVFQENQKIVIGNIEGAYKRLLKRLEDADYLEDGYWTPQTQMLRSIRNTILKIDGYPKLLLSIDKNPYIEKMIQQKWPECEIINAIYPEVNCQNLTKFNSETFDIVISHQVLEHIPKPWIAAQEMNRVLKKGGIGIHTSCAYNPRHGLPEFNDYYRFLPDGLEQLFENISVWEKNSWGSKEAIIYNLTIDDGFGGLGGRRFHEKLGIKNNPNYPWHTWIVFQKN